MAHLTRRSQRATRCATVQVQCCDAGPCPLSKCSNHINIPFNCYYNASYGLSCLQDDPRDSSSSGSKDDSNTALLWLFGLGSLLLAAASTYAVHTTACAAVCSLTRLLAAPEMPLRLAMSTAALLVALPQLLLVTCTLAWSAFVLLAPVVSSETYARLKIGKRTASERMSAVTGDAMLVVVCLAGLVVMMWSMNSAYERDLPVSVVELVVFCGVMLTMSSLVVFWAVDLCASIDDALSSSETDYEELPALCDGTESNGKQNAKLKGGLSHAEAEWVASMC